MTSGTVYIKSRIVQLYDTYMQNLETSGIYQSNINAYFSTNTQNVIRKSCIAPHYIAGIQTYY